jgi:prefoldin subunit 5
MQQGNSVLYPDENGSLEPGIFVKYTNVREEKAMIFIGSGYKNITKEELIPLTTQQLEALLNQLKNLQEKYREITKKKV